MTIEEAKRILHPDTSREAIREAEYDLWESGYSKEDAINVVEEACLLACEALEKQISKEVLETVQVSLRSTWYECPACEGDLTHVRSFYCPYCGQKLAWN